MQRLLDNFRFYVENLAWQRQEVFSRSAQGQSPLAVMVTCSDSRILPETFLRLDPGDLFVVRNAGNMIPDLDAGSGELASIEYAVKVLLVKDVVVCGHYHCGAIKALIAEGPMEGLDHVPAWLKHGGKVLEQLRSKHATEELSEIAREEFAIEANALEQVKRLSEVPFIQQRLGAGEVRLYAWVLRFESNQLVSYDPHQQRFVSITGNPMSHPVFPLKSDCCKDTLETELPQANLMEDESKPTRTWQAWAVDFKSDFVASIVLFCVSLPFCIAIARASNTSMASSLTAAIVASWLATALSGNRILVSGPSTSLIAIVATCVSMHGLPALAISIVCAGLIQIVLGLLRIGRYFRATSPAIVQGLLAGIGAALVVQQFHLSVDEAPFATSWRNLLDLPMAVVNIFLDHGHPGHRPAAMVGLITILSIVVWDRRKGKFLGWMPSVLIGIAIATILRATFALPIETVRVEAGLVSWVDWKSVSWTPQFFGAAILPTSIALALAASSESLLTLFSMSDSDKTRPPRPNRELVSQGIGNVVSGALGGLPIAIAMVRSQANRELDAKSYLSVLLHSMWLILFAGAVPFVLARVPTSALAAVLMITGFKMIDVSANRNFVREHRIEGGIGIITAISVFFFGILIGVAIGVLCSVAALVHTFSRLRIRIVESSSLQWTEIVLEGNANFLRLPKLGDALESMASRPSIRINTAALSYLDHATFSFLEKWAGDRAASGQTTELDLVTLRSRLQHRQPRPRNTPESL